jgi:hypothetical protein
LPGHQEAVDDATPNPSQLTRSVQCWTVRENRNRCSDAQACGRSAQSAPCLASLATREEISFKAGRVAQTNFDSYDVTRIGAAPAEIRTHLLIPTGYDKPLGGVGEPGFPPVAPALTNAIYAASGKRTRALPIRDQLAQRT